MKLLLVSPFTSISGSAIRFRHIAEHLARRGHRVVYVERHPKGAPVPRLRGVEYHRTPALANLYLDITLSLIHTLWLLVCHLDCSVYYALKPAPNNGVPALIAKLLGKRILLDIDDLDYGYFSPGGKRTLSRYFFDRLPRHFELITFHTRMLGEYITGQLRIPQQRTWFLPQGVSDVFLDYDIARRPATIPESIVYTATLGITSDFGDVLPVLAKLCRNHPDLTINVVGDGVRREEFQRQAGELGIEANARFHGRIAHERLPELMAGNWIGLNYMRPSLTNDCRAILKIREYLAVGLAVVCNDVGDAREFADHIHLESDLDAIEQRLDTLLSAGRCDNHAGREYVRQHLRWERVVKAFAERAGL
jgi:glycosyltransferase involved in cell wall biosynthesis